MKLTNHIFFRLRQFGLARQTGESEENIKAYIVNELHRCFRFVHLKDGTDVFAAFEDLSQKRTEEDGSGERRKGPMGLPTAKTEDSSEDEGSRSLARGAGSSHLPRPRVFDLRHISLTLPQLQTVKDFPNKRIEGLCAGHKARCMAMRGRILSEIACEMGPRHLIHMR